MMVVLYLWIVNDWGDNQFRVSKEKSLHTAADVVGSKDLHTEDRSRCYTDSTKPNL